MQVALLIVVHISSILCCRMSSSVAKIPGGHWLDVNHNKLKMAQSKCI